MSSFDRFSCTSNQHVEMTNSLQKEFVESYSYSWRTPSQSNKQKEKTESSTKDRSTIIAGACAEAIPAGLGQALVGVDQLALPLSERTCGKRVSIPVPVIVENAAIGATLGFASRYLAQSGPFGKVAALALGAIFTAPLVNTGLRIFKESNTAKTPTELRAAGHDLGYSIGNFAGNLPVGILAFRAGAGSGIKSLHRVPASTQNSLAEAKFCKPEQTTTAHQSTRDLIEFLRDIQTMKEAKVNSSTFSKQVKLADLETAPGQHELQQARNLTTAKLDDWDSRDLLSLLSSKNNELRSFGQDSVDLLNSDLLNINDQVELCESHVRFGSNLPPH